ncbi:ectonucleoside triphosphate diphosphohydrolase 5-like [Melanaphis sacchari]|uniref:ectonucleoside triphosphate diphosphohydrolase 5-like n=1 Tax=Melanaphis sacchari TaxID=742174 RepID=UPI000DC156AD|nr:ectonucleoside triphosphate diphosphohydrolase 5-like [Melanaphis sacchari]
MVTYSHSIILCEETAKNENSELTKSESPKLYCNVTIEADSIRTKLLITVFVKKSKKRSWFSFWGNPSEESYYELIDHVGRVHEGGIVQLYNKDKLGRIVIYDLVSFGQSFLKYKYKYEKTLLVFALTAGLRVFNKETEAIIHGINKMVTEYDKEYQINENTIFVMNEIREGLYAWLTVNFMNNTIKNFNNTIAVLDLRDSSLQIIFYLPPENLQNYEAKFVKQFTIMGIERHFYNQSHLDFGFMEMRIKVLTFNNHISTYSSPCHRTADNFSYTYFFENYKITGSSPKNDIYKLCLSAVQSLIEENVNKVTIKQPIMAISFFHETALKAKLIRNTGKRITIEKFNNAAKQCFRKTFDGSKPFKCFDLVYIYVLFSQLIDFGDNPSITVKKYDIISEISWALGADYLKLPIIDND